ncbi:hypothetical protein [Micromonospora cremea]|uniref:Immunity protein Imm1 n=1 Tax=Micromonospora cremea TaxID=709881 RepID=A0A1N5WS73_9ACTN|nr:hypothetical protein [Micromonospora cremea]SIM88128.1 hypothetical protein SAMN04489832_2717 [Micromonospora cremea]
MDGHWREPDRHAPLTGVQAADVVRSRIGQGRLETWFEHDRGRLLAVVSDGTRASVMLLDEPSDPGEHAIDPTGTGQQDGFVLSNGQHDAYSDRDTVPLGQALAIVEHIVDHGHPPASVGWQVDR